ncbi:MAG: hypothetical protein WC329_07870, partial [Candidatus Omnitrophota bacterium]
QNTLGLGLNPQIKKELCFILDSFIAFHLGKQMKSQAVMEQLQAPAVAALNSGDTILIKPQKLPV